MFFCYEDRFHKLSKTCLDLVICCERTTKQKGDDAFVEENNVFVFESGKKREFMPDTIFLKEFLRFGTGLLTTRSWHSYSVSKLPFVQHTFRYN